MGAPPTNIFTWSRIPASRASVTTRRISPMVVVSRDEQAITPQRCRFAVSTNCSGVTSTPRSMTSTPLPSSMIFTRFLPMSCISPRTVPMQARPTVLAFPPVISGFSSPSAAVMHRAAISISGTKARLAEKASPRSFMPRISPPDRISCGVRPCSSASRHSASTFFCCPFSSAAARRASTSPFSTAAPAACRTATARTRRGTDGRSNRGTCSARL